MKSSLFYILFFLYSSISAQCIYDYEKEIIDTTKYDYEEIKFQNKKDKIYLSGTLISPKEGFEKLVIIVPGSGKDTRNSHFVLAEELLKNGIGIYRFDERGIGKSKGKYDYKATTLASDLGYCYQKLRNSKGLSGKKIGVLGHSLGGLASLNSYQQGMDFDFMILMGTPIEKNGAFIKYQSEQNSDGFYSIKGKSNEEVVNFVERMISHVVQNKDDDEMRKSAKKLMKEMNFKKGLHLVINPLQIDLIRLNHENILRDFKKPMLYLMGSEDRIVSSKNETELLKSFDNKMIEIKIIEKTNHWLSPKISPTKMELELYQMEKDAMDKIVTWTLKL